MIKRKIRVNNIADEIVEKKKLENKQRKYRKHPLQEQLEKDKKKDYNNLIEKKKKQEKLNKKVDQEKKVIKECLTQKIKIVDFEEMNKLDKERSLEKLHKKVEEKIEEKDNYRKIIDEKTKKLKQNDKEQTINFEKEEKIMAFYYSITNALVILKYIINGTAIILTYIFFDIKITAFVFLFLLALWLIQKGIDNLKFILN